MDYFSRNVHLLMVGRLVLVTEWDMNINGVLLSLAAVFPNLVHFVSFRL